MKLLYNSLILLVTLLLATTAFSGKKARQKEPEKKLPIVAVANLKVESTNENVQKKIAELTDKVRDAVASSTTTCEVIPTKKMKGLMKKHGKAMAKCYDDCDVEFGLLIGADFVISGTLAPTADSVMTTLEIRDTRTRNVVSTKKIEGNNYFALESSMMSAMRRFVKPLNNIVVQATDDEVLADKPKQEPAPQEGEGDMFGAPPSDGATEAGQGGQTGGTQEGSEYLARPTKTAPTLPPTPLGQKWEAVKEEPPLLKAEDLGFKKAEMGKFGIGIVAGYPLNVARAKELRDLYAPIFHIGIELLARIHHLLDVGIIVDLDYLTGRQSSNSRFGAPGLGNCVYPDDYDDQNLRQCYASGSTSIFRYDYDDQTRNFSRMNWYTAGSYWAVGVRPTIRLVLPIGITETLIGAGIGLNYAKTNGKWRTQASGEEYLPGSLETQRVSEDITYNINMSDIGFYGVFEFALTFRLLDKRLGVGPYFSYKLPAISKKGVDAKVTLYNNQGFDSTVINEPSELGVTVDNPQTPQNELAERKKDILESPFGHTEMMNLFTLGLTADWRF